MPFNRKGGGSSSGGGSSTTSGLVTYNATRPVLPDGGSEPIQGDSLGNQYTNPGIYNTPSFVASAVSSSTTTSSPAILAANLNRSYIAFQNTTAINVWVVPLSAGVTAATTAPPSFRIAASGGFYDFGSGGMGTNPGNAFAIIAESGTPTITVIQAA